MPRPCVPHPLVALVLVLVGCAGRVAAQPVALEPVATGLARPVAVLALPGAAERLLVVEQGGRVRLVEDGAVRAAPFLDLSDRTAASGERGLLGLALPPGYPEDRRVFAYYTDARGASVLASYPVDPAAGRADAGAETVRLRVAQPFPNHNGGALAFGPDGHLYLGLGDGGSGGDPLGHGQDLGTLLGAILRLDVSAPEGYTVPPDNPFVERPGARPEIWAYGLRNPWRFAFDPVDGALWIGDVGQNRAEEIDRQPGSSRGGENYGWNVFEGPDCFQPREGCRLDAAVAPVLSYPHGRDGRSVTGGRVYRGGALPALRGAYVFGDYVSGRVWAARPDGEGWRKELLLEAGFPVSSFGADAAGELLLTDHAGGRVLRLVPAR